MLVTLALARVLAEGAAPPPELKQEAVLMIKRVAQVGEVCDSGPDGGVPDGGVPDGGISDAMLPDAGVDPDGGVDPDAGVAPDAGMDAGPMCVPVDGSVITLVVQPRFTTAMGGTRFALLFVTPARPVVQTHDPFVFDELAEVTKPRVEVNRIEVEDPQLGEACDIGGCAPATYEPPPSWDTTFTDAGVPTDGGGEPTIETIGPYEVVRSQPASTVELSAWLDGLGYTYQQEDLDATAPYIARGYTVVALRVAVDRMTTQALSPIALTWPGSELTLPASFGGPMATTTVVYIAADQRYDLEGAYVAFSKRTSNLGYGWLTRNELVLASDSPDEDPGAVAGGGLEKEEVQHVDKYVRIPVRDCGDFSCCPECSSRRGPSPVSFAMMLGVGFWIARKRRPRLRSRRE